MLLAAKSVLSMPAPTRRGGGVLNHLVCLVGKVTPAGKSDGSDAAGVGFADAKVASMDAPIRAKVFIFITILLRCRVK